MIIWIGKPLIFAVHDRQLAEHGGTSGLRDESLLESALARPQQLFACGDPPPDVADLAATLAYALARNHPFVDGNKRSAFVACRTFLALNGVDLDAPAEEKYLNFLALAEGHLSAEALAHWLRAHIPPTPASKVQESTTGYRQKKVRS